MIVRLLGSTAVLAGVIAPSVRTPVASTLHYKIATTSTQEVDLTALGGPKQSTTTNVAGFMTVTLVDSAGGKTIHVVIDSISPDSATRAQIPAAVLDTVKGATFHGYVDSKGSLGDFKTVKGGGALASQLSGQLDELFPKIASSAKVGDTWSDSTDRKREIGGGSIQVRRVVNYKASSNETVAGAKALKVDAAFSASQAGTQETPGGTADIQGTSSGTASYLVNEGGAVVSGTRTETVKLLVAIAQAPSPIPVTQTSTSTISVVK